MEEFFTSQEIDKTLEKIPPVHETPDRRIREDTRGNSPIRSIEKAKEVQTKFYPKLEDGEEMLPYNGEEETDRGKFNPLGRAYNKEGKQVRIGVFAILQKDDRVRYLKGTFRNSPESKEMRELQDEYILIKESLKKGYLDAGINLSEEQLEDLIRFSSREGEDGNELFFVDTRYFGRTIESLVTPNTEEPNKLLLSVDQIAQLLVYRIDQINYIAKMTGLTKKDLNINNSCVLVERDLDNGEELLYDNQGNLTKDRNIGKPRLLGSLVEIDFIGAIKGPITPEIAKKQMDKMFGYLRVHPEFDKIVDQMSKSFTRENLPNVEDDKVYDEYHLYINTLKEIYKQLWEEEVIK